MIQSNNKYVYGTAAEKIEYNVYEENVVLKKKKQQRSNTKAKFKMIGYILTAFAVCFIIMLRYALITDINYEISQMNKKYNDLRNDNSRLKVALEKEVDLHKVRDVAETKLGMHKPDKYQVVYIKVPKSDFTKVAEEEAKEIGNDIFAAISSKADKLTKLLY
ncbi:MAG: cell division protein FtsL [Clostridia bacterium]|nr:cell division protein FtsL [Clostridia bacterium]